MTILYTKYNVENNAVWTIHVKICTEKFGLKIMEFWNGKYVGTL